MVSYLSKGISQVKKPAQESKRSRKSNNKTYGNRKRARHFLFFLFHCFPTAFAQCYSDKHPLPWQTPCFAPSPCLSYVVSECQPSFAPPRELQASVTLSYMQHVKARHQASGHRSAQNQVKCQRLYPTLLVIVTFGEQKLVI